MMYSGEMEKIAPRDQISVEAMLPGTGDGGKIRD